MPLGALNAGQTVKARFPERKIYLKKMRVRICGRAWCEKRDLNPYGKNHTPLKRARLPVPPLSLGNKDIIPHLETFVKGFSEISLIFLKKFSAAGRL